MESFILTSKNKNAQIWSLDLIVAFIIFTTGIMVLYFYAINFTNQSEVNLNELLYEGDLASQLILHESDFGIISDGVVNQTKLDDFATRSYTTNKNQMGLVNDFYFSFDDLEIFGNPVDYVGYINSTQVDNFVKITRLSVYKNKPIKFELFIWN